MVLTFLHIELWYCDNCVCRWCHVTSGCLRRRGTPSRYRPPSCCVSSHPSTASDLVSVSCYCLTLCASIASLCSHIFLVSGIMECTCMLFTYENGVTLMRSGASVVWHHSLLLMNGFNKTEAAVFSCRLCFLRAFPFISFLSNIMCLVHLRSIYLCVSNSLTESHFDQYNILW